MRILSNDLNGVLKIEMDTYFDFRGWFSEGYNVEKFIKLGIDINFLQDNFGYTKQKGTIRGIHYQAVPYAQTKLFRCVKGKVFDVVVDLRQSSSTFLNWKRYELSEDSNYWILIPKGFGHAFQSITDDCYVHYKVDEYFFKEYDRSILWNDERIGIEWPINNPILSDKDRTANRIKDIIDFF